MPREEEQEEDEEDDEQCDWNASTDPTKRLKQSRYRLFSNRKYNTMVPR
jgi:hypothetical protein